MVHRRSAAGILAVVALFGAGAGCAVLRASAPDHVLRVADGLDVATLNPLYLRSNIGGLSDLTMAVFSRYDERGIPEPELLTEIPTKQNGGVSPDGRTITLHLRRGVRWSDGAPFDARDVLYTIAVLRDPRNTIPLLSDWRRVTHVAARGGYTVVLGLSAPFAPFVAICLSNWGNTVVLPEHILGPGTLFGESSNVGLPVGIGPFRYTVFRRGDVVEAEANPFYFRGRPKLTKIIYKIIPDENAMMLAFETGSIDLWASAPETKAAWLRSLRGKRVQASLGVARTAIYFNLHRTPFNDSRVRRALRLALDRELILHKVFHGAGSLSESPVAQVSQDYDPGVELDAYDPRTAARLLDSAGWTRGVDGLRRKRGVPLLVRLGMVNGKSYAALVANVVRDAWQAVGATVAVRSYGQLYYYADVLPKGTFDAAIASVGGGVDADMYAVFGCSRRPPRGANYEQYCSRVAERDMLAYNASFDAPQRKQLASRFQHEIADDVPVIMLLERATLAASDDRLAGFHPKPFGQDDFLNVDIRR